MTGTDEWAWFLVDRHLDRMTGIVANLGDDLCNVTPDLPGANSAYQILLHCCGMLEWWTRAAVLGLPVERDRDGEFTATGTVDQLLTRVVQAREGLLRDLGAIDPSDPLRGDPSEHYRGTAIAASAHGVLLHVLEELAQHHGHLEITRDLVRTGRGQ